VCNGIICNGKCAFNIRSYNVDVVSRRIESYKITNLQRRILAHKTPKGAHKFTGWQARWPSSLWSSAEASACNDCCAVLQCSVACVDDWPRHPRLRDMDSQSNALGLLCGKSISIRQGCRVARIDFRIYIDFCIDLLHWFVEAKNIPASLACRTVLARHVSTSDILWFENSSPSVSQSMTGNLCISSVWCAVAPSNNCPTTQQQCCLLTDSITGYWLLTFTTM